jgi:hypothetical protein
MPKRTGPDRAQVTKAARQRAEKAQILATSTRLKLRARTIVQPLVR